jgi:hypothetical protein
LQIEPKNASFLDSLGRALLARGELKEAERLPAIAIPLRQTDRDVPLDLQSLIDQCYESAEYDDIDYHQEPDPPLSRDDAEWADALLREQGFR